MKPFRSFSLLLFLVAGLFGAFPRSARADVSFDFFYDSLSPLGQWIEVSDYGYCWRPSDVDADWTPYSEGYWTYTDAGWTWVSYEDFGGITYHYGRWTLLEDEGWCWVPGTEWGPAWVSWRNSDDYVGWAPLPPEARWQPSIGFSVWVDNSYDIGPGYYNFCHSYDFGAPFLRPCILPRRQNITIINKTVNITNITYNNVSKVVYNGGPNFAAMNRRSRRPIPALKLVQRANMDDLRDGRNRRGKGLLHAEQRGNQLEVVAPTIVRGADEKAFKPNKIAKVVSKEKVNKGWASVKDPEQRRAIKEQMAQQTRNLSPETAPAKPVQTADLAVVPDKADPNAPSPAKTGRNQAKDNEKSIAADNEKAPGNKNKETVGGPATAGADNDRKGKGQGRNKTDAIAAPVPVSPDAPVASTETDRNGKRDAADKEPREKNAKRQAGRDANDESPKETRKAIATDEKAAKRRALENEMARDQAELAAARARRQQEAQNGQEEKRRENQRAAIAEQQERQQQRARQRDNDDNDIRRQRQQQSQQQSDGLRQQALRERQSEAQRDMQQQRARQQQQQQSRALEAQRAAQQQRQMQIQRQQQQQFQQRQQGGGGGGGGKRQQTDDERDQKKKNRGF